MGIPVGDLSPRGTGMGKKCSPQVFLGIPAGKFFCRGDGDGELFPCGEFPVAIPTLAASLAHRALGWWMLGNQRIVNGGWRGMVGIGRRLTD
jgi:hypothetical protein